MTDPIDADVITDDALMPEGEKWATDDESGEPNFGDIRVNFTKEEAASVSFDDLPNGKYLVAITGGKVKTSNSEKNKGKPYYNLEYTVQEGPHTGRKLFDNVMLFEGALYSLSNLMKALGVDINTGTFKVPTIEELTGSRFIARVIKSQPRKVGDKTYDARSEVKGYFKVGAPAQRTGDDLLAP